MANLGDLRINSRGIFQMYAIVTPFPVPIPGWTKVPVNGWSGTSLRDLRRAFNAGARTMAGAKQWLAIQADEALMGNLGSGGGQGGGGAPYNEAGVGGGRGGGPTIPVPGGSGGKGGSGGGDFYSRGPEVGGWGNGEGFGLGDGDQYNNNFFWPRPGREAYEQAMLKLAMSQDALLAKNAAGVPVQGDTKQLNINGYAVDKLAAVVHAAYVAPGTTVGRGEYLAALLVTGAVGNKFDVVGGATVGGSASWDSSDNVGALGTVAGSKVSTYVIGSGGAYLLRLAEPVQLGDGTESQLGVRLYSTGMTVTGEFYASLDAARQYGPKLQLGGGN